LNASAAAGRERRPGAAAILGTAVVGIWLLTRPYFGPFHHDGLFYYLLALHATDPGALGHDLFLQFDAQRKFTIFPQIYATLIDALGPIYAAMSVQIAGGAAWLAALYAIARNWYPPQLAWLAVTVVVSLPLQYSALALAIGEPIVSPRLPAEALALAAVACAVRDRIAESAACALAAAAIHPLTAPAAIGVLFIRIGLERPLAWWLVPAGAAVALGVGVGGVAPFDGIFEAVDTEWRTILEFRNGYLFPSDWAQDAWAVALLPILVLSAVAIPEELAPLRRWAVAVAATVALGVAGSLVFGDRLGNVFVLQLQPWRLQWLGLTIALLTTPALVLTLWRHSECGRTAALLFIAAWATNQSSGAVLLGCVALALVAARERLASHVPRTATWLAGLAVACCLGLWIANWYLIEAKSSISMLQSQFPAWVTLLRMPSILLSIFGIFLVLIHYSNNLYLPILLSLTFLIFGVSYWDRMATDKRRLATAVAPLPRELENFPPGTQVLWPLRPEHVWHKLRYASYVSNSQGAALVFDRATALKWRSRMQRTAPFRLGTLSPSEDGWQKVTAGTPIRPEHLALTCRMNPELDLVVSNHDWPEFDSMPFSPYDSEVFFNAYRCAQFRNNRDRPPRQPANLP